MNLHLTSPSKIAFLLLFLPFADLLGQSINPLENFPLHAQVSSTINTNGMEHATRGNRLPDALQIQKSSDMSKVLQSSSQRLNAYFGNGTTNPTSAMSSATSWKVLPTPSEGVVAVEITVHNNQLYMADNFGRIFNLNTDGNWTQIGVFPGYFRNGPYPYPDVYQELQVNSKMIFYRGNYSLDNGKTWGDIFKNSDNSMFLTDYYLRFQGFVISGNDIYAYSDRRGAFKTSDYGATWTRMSAGLPSDPWYGFTNVTALTLNNGTPYCMVQDYQHNAGDPWWKFTIVPKTFEWNGNYWMAKDTINLVNDRGTDKVVVSDMKPFLMKTDKGYYYSEPGAELNWYSTTDVSFSDTTWMPISIKKMGANEILALGKDKDTKHWAHKAHSSSDRGENWTTLNVDDTTSWASFYGVYSIGGIGTTAYATSSSGIYKSTSPYKQWDQFTKGLQLDKYETFHSQADSRIVRVGNKLLAASINGLYHSLDNGETWQLLNNDLHHAYIYSIIKKKNDVYSFSWMKGIMKSTDEGLTWKPLTKPAINYDNGYMAGIFSNETSLFAIAFFSHGSKVYRSEDDGANWKTVWQLYDSTKANSTNYELRDEVYSYETDGTNIYLGTGHSDVYISKDNGETWTHSSIGLPSVTYSYGNVNFIYHGRISEIKKFGQDLFVLADPLKGGYMTQLYRSQDGGANWSRVVIDSAFENTNWPGLYFSEFSSIKKINNTLVIYAYKGGSPPAIGNNYYWYYFEPSAFKSYFFTSNDNGSTWKQVDTNTDSFSGLVTTLFSSGDKMFATLGWIGGGLYRAPLSVFGIDPPVELYTQKTHSQKNKEVVVPVKANYFKKLISTQLSVNWNPQVATYVGVEAFGLKGVDANSFGTSTTTTGQLSFSWSDPNLSAQTLADSSTLFNIRFKLTGNYGAKTPVMINSQPLAIEVINKTFNNVEFNTWSGILTIDSVITVVGKVFYPNSEPVQSVTVNLNGGAPQNSVTDAAGSFSFIAPAGINYSLTPLKVNDPKPLNGIDVQDVASVRRHILGVQSLSSSYQIISADVNESNTISTLDIDYIQALILGVSNNFPNGNQWTFTPKDYAFPDASNPFPYPHAVNLSQVDGQLNQDFIGMKLGDVNNSRDNSQPNRQSAAAEFVFVIDGSKLSTDIFEVPIQVRNFEGISAYQFTVNWDAERLEYQGIINENTNGHFGDNRTSEGILTTLWDEGTGKSKSLSYESDLFKIQFLKKGASASIADININSALTNIAVYDKDLKAVAYRIEKKQDEPSATFELFQNFPNSFSRKTEISFSIPLPGEVVIEIMDVEGHVVKSVSGAYDNGIHFLEWNGTDDNGCQVNAGLYIYAARYANTTKAKKMIKN